MRNLTLKGKIVIFKTLAISKIVFQSLITLVPRHIVNELEKIQKVFLWKNSSPEMKHETLCNDYKGGDLKNIDIKKSFASSFKFHSNLFFKRNKVIRKSFYTGKNILLESLKSHFAFCLNIYGTMKISR